MGATRRELKRASAFGAKPVLAEAIELYHKRSICSHFHLSVLIGARIGAERLQADDCSTAGDGTQGYSHLRGIRPEAAALGEDVGCSAAAKLSNEEGHLVRRITPLLAPSTTDCTKGPHGPVPMAFHAACSGRNPFVHVPILLPILLVVLFLSRA